MGLFGKSKKAGGPFRFRVSDAVSVPMRGYLLRLKLVEGAPSLDDLRPGERIRIRSPEGGDAEERVVEIKDFSTTTGRPSQERLETKRELDIVIAGEDAVRDDRPVEIGWFVEGPVRG